MPIIPCSKLDGETDGGMAEERPATFSSTPPSPGHSPVELSECIEELVKFTLSTHLKEGSLGLGFSPRYCSLLLQDEPLPIPHDSLGGVPQYPLYRHLARAIDRSIDSGAFSRALESIDSIPVDDESLKSREKEWSELIVDKGSELLNILKSVEFELHVQEPFFSQLTAGLKTVEGRCAVGNYSKIGPGSLLLFNRCLVLKVQHVKKYSSFCEMLQTETIAEVLPGVGTIEEGVQIYRKFYTEEKEKSNGVLAISVSRPVSQPYITMAGLLSGLSYDGVSGLLGLMHTAGTVPDALPPPKSSLVSSSMKPHRPDRLRVVP